jgi:hypothetical protein
LVEAAEFAQLVLSAMRYETIRHTQAPHANIADSFLGEKLQYRAAESADNGVVFNRDESGNPFDDVAQEISVQRLYEASIDHRRIDSQGGEILGGSQRRQYSVANGQNYNVLAVPHDLGLADLKIA